MSAVAGKTTRGKVWHVAVFARPPAKWWPLCADPTVRTHLTDRRPLATVPAYGLCQHCERASEQIARAIAEVQS